MITGGERRSGLKALAKAKVQSSEEVDTCASEDDSLLLNTALMGELQVPGAADCSAELHLLSERAALYASRARGEGTRQVYRSAWCRSLGR